MKIFFALFISLFIFSESSAGGRADEWREVFESTLKMSQYYGKNPDLIPHKPFSELSDEEANILLDSDTIIVIYQCELISHNRWVSITGKTYTKEISIYDVNDEEALKRNEYYAIGTIPKGDPIYKTEEDFWFPYLRPGKNPFTTLIYKLEHWDIPIPMEIFTKLKEEGKYVNIEAFRVIRHDNGEFSIDHYFIPIEEYNKA